MADGRSRGVVRRLPTAGSQIVASFSASLGDDEEFDEREAAILDLARRQADDVQMLEDLLTSQGPTVLGSQGQVRLSATVQELRLSRLALARLLEQIRLPGEGVGASRNVQKARAANIRWNRERSAG